MTDTIAINKDTPTDELLTVLEIVLSSLVERVGVGATVGMLFGTAILMTVEDGGINDR